MTTFIVLLNPFKRRNYAISFKNNVKFNFSKRITDTPLYCAYSETQIVTSFVRFAQTLYREQTVSEFVYYYKWLIYIVTKEDTLCNLFVTIARYLSTVYLSVPPLLLKTEMNSESETLCFIVFRMWATYKFQKEVILGVLSHRQSPLDNEVIINAISGAVP
jgi:hypothetical protein